MYGFRIIVLGTTPTETIPAAADSGRAPVVAAAAAAARHDTTHNGNCGGISRKIPQNGPVRRLRYDKSSCTRARAYGTVRFKIRETAGPVFGARRPRAVVGK